MLQYRANKCVFKSLRKLSLVTLGLGSLKLSGNEFQTVLYIIIQYIWAHKLDHVSEAPNTNNIAAAPKVVG